MFSSLHLFYLVDSSSGAYIAFKAPILKCYKFFCGPSIIKASILGAEPFLYTKETIFSYKFPWNQ